MATAVVTATTASFGEETHEDWHEFEVQEPKILVKKTSMQSERQISVDPKSLKALSLSASMRRNISFNLVPPPAIPTPRDLDVPLPLPLQPVRTKFVSCSLPNSASTSPRQNSGVLKGNKNRGQDLDLRPVGDRAVTFRRSKSCGEGRACAPSLDFDILMHRSKHGNHQTSFSSKTVSHMSSISSSFSKTESSKSNRSIKSMNSFEDGFKCSALCLYLPGFGKGKPVRSSRKDDSFTRTTTMASSTARTASIKDNNTVISARASLEKFECGSWSSSALIYEDNVEAGGHFFDLPSELIKGGSGGNDQDEPVSAAFVFDKEPLEKEIKGVLKTSGSKSRRSTESPRHVRFSTSSPVSYPASPTSITPRLIQASQDLSIFMEAQTV
ncbi:PREDICTED: uncharacterized protein LOC104811927 [Tarenaya hassleriana]|uniref:uncharacterized protein LOC104811927 n=1 Tax=Tarenaya hassleriana TaxID=28532 RepID=UPI00053C8E60|nr:PREDICTED: uncharacterized protein LOC104811927 [Tarenaya hassleriana]